MGGTANTLLQALFRPTELRALVTYKVWHDPNRDIKDPKEHITSGWDRASMRECWGLLDLTSRSFSAVIKELDGDLARVVCLFYLVLRALDTIEDDMTIPNSIKLPLLNEFHAKLDQPGWNFTGSGPNEKDRDVLVKYDVVIEEFQRLEKSYRDVIQGICRHMGKGMASFAALATPEQPVAEVNSIEDYDLYCHYVAGLVGEGLSGLFAASGKERGFMKDLLTLSNHMGLLLQKTNITRDFREDVDEGRGFWPRAIWGKHGFDKMGDLRDPEREEQALWALSEMILDALRHVTPALDYLSLLKNQSVFNFVAIPAVMAIATLERCYGNPDVLKKNVKIRKGEALKLMRLATNPRDVAYCFVKYGRLIHAKVKVQDPNFVRLSIALGKIEQWTEHHYPSFVVVTSSPGGPATSAIDLTSGDARAVMYHRITEDEKARRAAVKREEFMEKLRAKGILNKLDSDGKEIIPAGYRPPAENEGLGTGMILAMLGAIVFMLLISVGLVVAAVWYLSEH